MTSARPDLEKRHNLRSEIGRCEGPIDEVVLNVPVFSTAQEMPHDLSSFRPALPTCW